MTDTVLVATRRFGPVEIDPATIIEFPEGLLGLETQRRWCLLHHEGVEHLDWLQCVDDPELSLLLVDPDHLFADYAVRVESEDIEPLELSELLAHDQNPPIVMRVIIRPVERSGNFVINVRAPLLFNLENRKGMQLVLETGRLPAHFCGPVELSVDGAPPS